MVPDGGAACRSVDAGRGGLYRAAMNDEQRFLFDLQGFLVVPGVLSAAELATLNAIADEKAERYSSRWRTGKNTSAASGASRWSI